MVRSLDYYVLDFSKTAVDNRCIGELLSTGGDPAAVAGRAAADDDDEGSWEDLADGHAADVPLQAQPSTSLGVELYPFRLGQLRDLDLSFCPLLASLQLGAPFACSVAHEWGPRPRRRLGARAPPCQLVSKARGLTSSVMLVRAGR